MRRMGNNPLGIGLASACVLLLLISAALAYVWSRPASSGAEPFSVSAEVDARPQQLVSDIGPITDFRVFTERPLFNETRKPVVNVEVEGSDLDDMIGEVADVPDVKLTGVVITPDRKIVTLKPASNGKSVIARIGEPLDGDYFGWSVSDINPRSIVLASRDGGRLELDLQVNTRKIEEPPSPEPEVDREVPGDASEGTGEQPLSRAEEIRQRIAQRREELRKQADDNNDSDKKRTSTSAYQSAIQNMIQRNKDNENEDKNGDGSDR